ncbi:esterase E4 isoform X2 [Athalia rosae]|nr:esterase E4 isoform X2 [Athalia rosae]XP_020707599.2 esterase E4 isoform X2 [Athalia rosae]
MAFPNRIERLSLVCLLCILCPATFAQPEVQIAQGSLQGLTWTSFRGRNISAFIGIPYAKPPIGNLRFASPVAADAWNGTFNATVPGSVCVSLRRGVAIGVEDCLNLNVFTPQLPEDGTSPSLPVMVWVHGGGFVEGNSLPRHYGPRYLLDEDIVLVTFNYRLGPIGFLSAGDEVLPGNWGMKDQVLALKWVQENIAKFGGNPERVTIFGQSAGSAAVQLLALSESTKGLFHQYISQSGGADSYWSYRPKESYAKYALALGEYFNCPTNATIYMLECLRELDAGDIVEAKLNLSEWYYSFSVAWGPTDEVDIEGAFLTDRPKNLLAAGKVRDVPSITGVVRNECDIWFTYMLPDSKEFEVYLSEFDEQLPVLLQCKELEDDVPSFIAKLKEFYFNNDLTGDRSEIWIKNAQLVTDSFFFNPVYSALKYQLASASAPVYFYSFEYRGTDSELKGTNIPTESTAIVHSDDLRYLFPLGRPVESESQWSDSDFIMIDTMVQLWTSFAINGTPRARTSDLIWTPYSSDDNYLRIGNSFNESLKMVSVFRDKRMKLWAELQGESNSESLDKTMTKCENKGIVTLDKVQWWSNRASRNPVTRRSNNRTKAFTRRSKMTIPV